MRRPGCPAKCATAHCPYRRESFQPSVEIFPNVHDTPQADPLRVFHSQSNAWRDRLSALKNVPRVLAVFREARTLNGWIHTLRSRR
jgi:hypothetical protein